MELQEILQALKEGRKVHFKSSHYDVVLEGETPYIYNKGWKVDSLREGYLEDCFIKGQ